MGDIVELSDKEAKKKNPIPQRIELVPGDAKDGIENEHARAEDIRTDNINAVIFDFSRIADPRPFTVFKGEAGSTAPIKVIRIDWA